MLKSQRQTKSSTETPSDTARNRQSSSDKPQRRHVESSHRILVRCKLRCNSAFSLLRFIQACKNGKHSRGGRSDDVECRWSRNLASPTMDSSKFQWHGFERTNAKNLSNELTSKNLRRKRHNNRRHDDSRHLGVLTFPSDYRHRHNNLP